MAKKIIIIAVVICMLVVGGKIVCDKATEFIAYKGLSLIANSPVEGWFDFSSGGDEQDNSSTQSIPGQISEDGKIIPGKTAEEDKQTNDKNKQNAKPGKQSAEKDDGISPEDKAYVMGIYSRYTAAEISEVTAIMSGKVTPEKKARAKQIVFSKMSKAEYNKVMELARKYGY